MMTIPVVFRMSATRYIGPNTSTLRWHGQATIFGRPICDLPEIEGRPTKTSAENALRAKIREFVRTDNR